MKVREIRELSPRELADMVVEKAEELTNLKFQLALHQLDNTAKVRIARRELARLQTIQKEHQLGIRKLTSADIGPVKETR